MKSEHNRQIITAGYSYDEIGYCLCELVRKYGKKLMDIYVDCDGIYFTTIEYIK